MAADFPVRAHRGRVNPNSRASYTTTPIPDASHTTSAIFRIHRATFSERRFETAPNGPQVVMAVRYAIDHDGGLWEANPGRISCES